MTIPSWPIWLVLGVVWTIAMSIVIVLQRRSPASTMAWLMVLAFLPVVGLGAYLVVGPMRLERKKKRRRMSRLVVKEALGAFAILESESHDPDVAELAHVAVGAGEAPPLSAERVDVYLEGQGAFDAIFAAIEAATHHVHVEYYIWEPDGLGTALRDLLCARARAGVKVRLLLDGLGAWGCSDKFLAPLTAAGVEVAWFNPIRFRLRGFRRPDFRTHRKIVVCDGVIGFAGGMNVTDKQTVGKGDVPAWRDTHVGFTGTAVRALQRVFLDDWAFAADDAPPIADPALFPTPRAPGPELVQVVSSGPDAATFAIHKTMFAAINASSRRLWITTPYFVPDDAISQALTTAAYRRVDVRLLIPKCSDSKLVDLAARSYVPELLDAGVRVFEYLPRFIHAKTIVVDEEVALVGSANLDNRSFRLNFEVAMLLYGAGPNALLATAFERDAAQARELTRTEFARAKFFTRLGQAGARLLSPFL